VAEAAVIIEENSPTANMYLARQPVFDAGLQVYAYELLHRGNNSNAAESENENISSSQVMINAFVDIGIETVCENLPAFIPVTRDFLVGRLPLPFPSKSVVLEIPADTPVDDDLLDGLQFFSSKGFVIALDNYSFAEDKSTLLEHVDIVKVDLTACDRDRLASDVANLARLNLKLIANHVATRCEFEDCKSAGFELFQGRFISDPVFVNGSVLKPGRLALLNVLKLLEDPDCDITALEQLISQDVTLSYKILRIINSAFYGFRRKIDSVKQAVVSLGLKVIRDWFIIISLTDVDDKPQELILLTLQRARMMQSLAEIMCMNKDTGFTTGLFSSIDAIMDQPMENILQSLPLSSEITEALLEREGPMGQLLNIVLHYEQGDWEYINRAGFETGEISTFYFEAMFWARGLVEQIRTDKQESPVAAERCH